jgi:hypothetical protein
MAYNTHIGCSDITHETIETIFMDQISRLTRTTNKWGCV